MAKTFKFDAIGRDLYPGERQAAQAFTRKYQSPPTQAMTHKEMAQVAGRVLKAASTLVTASATLKASTVTRGGRIHGSVKSVAASTLTAKATPKRPPNDEKQKKRPLGRFFRESSFDDNSYYHRCFYACFGRETGLGWAISAILNRIFHARYLSRAGSTRARRPATLRRRRTSR